MRSKELTEVRRILEAMATDEKLWDWSLLDINYELKILVKYIKQLEIEGENY